MGILTTALQLNYYLDDNCEEFGGFSIAPGCSAAPKNITARSWMIVCNSVDLSACAGLMLTATSDCDNPLYPVLVCPCPSVFGNITFDQKCMSASNLTDTRGKNPDVLGWLVTEVV